jgi:hypothetical protein
MYNMNHMTTSDVVDVVVMGDEEGSNETTTRTSQLAHRQRK